MGLHVVHARHVPRPAHPCIGACVRQPMPGGRSPCWLPGMRPGTARCTGCAGSTAPAAAGGCAAAAPATAAAPVASTSCLSVTAVHSKSRRSCCSVPRPAASRPARPVALPRPLPRPRPPALPWPAPLPPLPNAVARLLSAMAELLPLPLPLPLPTPPPLPPSLPPLPAMGGPPTAMVRPSTVVSRVPWRTCCVRRAGCKALVCVRVGCNSLVSVCPSGVQLVS